MGRRTSKEQRTLELNGTEPIQDLIKVERNLNSLGFFIPAKKGKPSREERSRVRTITYPSREVQGRMVRQSATIIPSPEHGLPATADRDKYMALQCKPRALGLELSEATQIRRSQCDCPFFRRC